MIVMRCDVAGLCRASSQRSVDVFELIVSTLCTCVCRASLLGNTQPLGIADWELQLHWTEAAWPLCEQVLTFRAGCLAIPFSLKTFKLIFYVPCTAFYGVICPQLA